MNLLSRLVRRTLFPLRADSYASRVNALRESVWDYPRPPAVHSTSSRVVITHLGRTIADTTSAIRVLETSHPPTYYLPRGDIALECIQEVPGHTWCEFKGEASYGDIVIDGHRIVRAVWWYENPSPGYHELRDHIAFYPGKFDSCTVDGEIVQAQEGDFYGGWITSAIAGPFKGGPGTSSW